MDCPKCKTEAKFLRHWDGAQTPDHAHNIYACDSCGRIIQERLGTNEGITALGGGGWVEDWTRCSEGTLDLVLDYLRDHPKTTATQIAKVLGKSSCTISEVLYKCFKSGRVTTIQGIGPRGGYGYSVVEVV